MPVRVRTMIVPMRTEIYAVASADGTPEETREALADVLRTLAEEVRRPGWGGGRYGRALDGGGLVKVEADLVDPWAEPDSDEDEDIPQAPAAGDAGSDEN